MDIKLNYIEKGKGEVLILLHGNGEDNTYFVNQIDFFSDYYRVIAIDTRGHGKSERGTKPFSIKQFAEDLNDFMTDRNISKAHILGFSDGGNIALTFTLKYQEKVDKLILNGANLQPSGVKTHIQLPIVVGYYLTKIAMNKSGDALKKHELLALMVKEPDIKPDELSSVKCKTLVIAGKNDMIKEGHSKLIHNSLPNAELAIIDGDHFVANKQYKIFNDIVYKFLQS